MNYKLPTEDAAFLASFVRRNRPLDSAQSAQLKKIIIEVSAHLIDKGFKKAAVKGFFSGSIQPTQTQMPMVIAALKPVFTDENKRY